MAKSAIKVGSVSLPLYETSKGWRVYYHDPSGNRKHVTSRDKAKVVDKARSIARGIHNQTIDLGALDVDQVVLLKRVISLGITHADLDEWERVKGIRKVSVEDAIKDFLEAKESVKGGSNRNYAELSNILERLRRSLGSRMLQDVTVKDLNAWLAEFKAGGVGLRRVKNLRGSVVTFFRWCRKQGTLPDVTTEAEKLEPVKVTRKVPVTWEPLDMQIILRTCREIAPEYIPWLVLTAFNGLRSEEIVPDGRSKKPPLDWSDFKWERGIIIVRAETAKTKERRVIPIHDVTRAWLEPLSQDKGSMCPQLQPASKRVNGMWLTKALGEPVGGWKTNANRHSFISYRAAQVGLAKTAMEAGNSESEARRSYNDAKSEAESKEWFSLKPDHF